MLEEQLVRDTIYNNLGGTKYTNYIGQSDWDTLYHNDNSAIANVMHAVTKTLKSYQQVIQSTDTVLAELADSQSNVTNPKGVAVKQTNKNYQKNIMWILNRDPKTDTYRVGKPAMTEYILSVVTTALPQVFDNHVQLTRLQRNSFNDYVEIMEAYQDYFKQQMLPYEKQYRGNRGRIEIPDNHELLHDYDYFVNKIKLPFDDDELNQMRDTIWARHDEEYRNKYVHKMAYERFYQDFKKFVVDLELISKFNR